MSVLLPQNWMKHRKAESSFKRALKEYEKRVASAAASIMGCSAVVELLLRVVVCIVKTKMPQNYALKLGKFFCFFCVLCEGLFMSNS